MDESLKNRVIDILEEEQSQLEGALDNQSSVTAPQTLEKISITQNSDGTWTKDVTTEESGLVDGSIDQANRSGVRGKAETLQEFCRVVDNRIISFNAEINDKKNLIVSLSTEAINGNCWPGIGYSATVFGGTTRNVVSAASSSFTSSVSINNEIENIKIYPKMAGPEKDFGAQNVFEPDTIYPMTSAYAGYGYRNLRDSNYYQNNDGSLTGSSIDGSGSNIGIGRFDISTTESDHTGPRVVFPFFAYAGAGVAPEASDTSVTAARCVSIASSISSIYNEILELRKQRDSLRSNLNTIKQNKLEKELASWGMSRVDNEISTRSQKNSTAISAVKSFNSDGTINVEALVLHLDVGNSDSYSGIGTSWNDISGYGNNVTLFPTGSPASYEYSDGGFLTFNGSDEYAESITKSTDIIGTGDWTIETWFKVNGSPDLNTYMNSIVDTNPSSNTGHMLHVPYGTVGDFVGLTTNTFTYSSRPTSGDSYTHLQASEITNGLWYHGVVVRNGTTNTKIYVNGQLKNTYDGDFPTNSEGFVRIARWSDFTVDANISVAVVKIYQRSFTDPEIKDKFDGSKTRFGLVG